MERFMVLLALGIYILVLIVLSVISRKQLMGLDAKKFVDEFYTAGRGMGAVVVTFMLAAGLASVGTMIGTPGLAYDLGITWAPLTNFQIFMNLMVLVVVGKKIGIIARRINARSPLTIIASRYEYHPAISIIGGVALIFFLIPYSTVQFVGGARLIEEIIHIDYVTSLFIVGGIVVVYTILGGVRGATLAAAFQGIIMTVTAIVLFIGVIIALGGVESAFTQVQEVDPELLQPTARGGIAQPHFLASFAILFGFVISGMPHSITPALIYKSTKALHRSILIGAVCVFLWTTLMAMTGTLANAIDPNIAVPDHAIPVAADYALPPFLRGVTIGGVTAAIQSTIAAMLILMSSAVATEMYKVLKKGVTDEDQKRVSQIATVVLCLVVFGGAFFPPDALEWIVYFAIAGLESSFFFPLVLGLYWKKANVGGALTGMIGGLLGYILVASFEETLALGMNPVAVSILIAFVCFMIGNYFGQTPSRETLMLYWGKHKFQ